MMKTFDHSELIESVNLKRQMVEGKRLYAVEDEHYPSVTTVLSNQKKKKAIINRWRKRVGKEEADEEYLKVKTSLTDMGDVLYVYRTINDD